MVFFNCLDKNAPEVGHTFNLNLFVFPPIPQSHLQLLSFSPTLIPSSTSTFSQFHTSSEQFVRSRPRIQLLIYEAGENELDKKNKEDNKKTKNSPKSKDAKSLAESHFEMDS
ncbi:hypothetical protein LguiA_035162 [Lonicera macranthoides]